MKGFKFSGIAAGIKKNNLKDLGLIVCDPPAAAAALFTKNKVVAAPVILGRQAIQKGRACAILVNSGNANCFTAEKGLENAKNCAQMVAQALKVDSDSVLVSSTGVIGQQLPMPRFQEGIPKAVDALEDSGFTDFAAAILTTDLVPKIVQKTIRIDGNPVEIMGIAKGSGMIRPNMATMLAFICTDAKISSRLLKKALTKSNEKSFNRISVDGDTSTNDTLFALAGGASNVLIENENNLGLFQSALDEVCIELSKKIVRDGEGATKLVKITVKGAMTQQDAFKAAETISHSNLVKTAIYGQDPNWGRITAAAGRSGAMVDQDKMDLFFGNQALIQKGQWMGKDIEEKVALLMQEAEIDITLDLNLGAYSDYFFFCDFSENYVKINADYRT